jgi:hypothetical protein
MAWSEDNHMERLATCDGEAEGFAKVLTCKGSGKIIGAAIVHMHAGRAPGRTDHRQEVRSAAQQACQYYACLSNALRNAPITGRCLSVAAHDTQGALATLPTLCVAETRSTASTVRKGRSWLCIERFWCHLLIEVVCRRSWLSYRRLRPATTTIRRALTPSATSSSKRSRLIPVSSISSPWHG